MYTIVIFDMTDAYYFADLVDKSKMKVAAQLESLAKAKALADALFVTLNYQWDSLSQMNDLDAGYDVRVYDDTYACVHKAHQTYQEKWIGQ